MFDGSYDAGHFGPPEGSLAIKNLRGVVNGRLGDPVIEAETLRAENGKITEIGGPVRDADVVIDAQGACAIPGLFDTHVHFALGDYTPRQHSIGFIESYMQGGVTSMMSACEVHLPGRPTDRDAVKALAVVAARAYTNFRPGGVHIHAGSVMCGPYMREEDYAELAKQGVWLMKIGFGGFTNHADAVPHVRAAKNAGFVIMSHSGGVSIPEASSITAHDLMMMDPHIAGHINGGTTSLPEDEVDELIRDSKMALQIVQAGNLSASLAVHRMAVKHNALDRIILGSDTPSGTGVMPLAIIKTMCEMSSLAGIPAADVVAYATGNCARVLRREEGILAVGRPADMVLIQEPLGGTKRHALNAIENGDLPGMAATIIGGQIRALKSRNTPGPARLVSVSRNR
jgi:enamidase